MTSGKTLLILHAKQPMKKLYQRDQLNSWQKSPTELKDNSTNCAGWEGDVSHSMVGVQSLPNLWQFQFSHPQGPHQENVCAILSLLPSSHCIWDLQWSLSAWPSVLDHHVLHLHHCQPLLLSSQEHNSQWVMMTFFASLSFQDML